LEQDRDVKLASSLERNSSALAILTTASVVLVSPFSFVFGLPFAIAPEVYLAFWLKYVFIFVLLAIVIASAGFAGASSYHVRAETIRRSAKKR
jgi:hypothetical protein